MFSLAVVNFISNVCILCFEQIQDWQDLSVIWNKGFSNSIRACHQSLQNLKSDCYIFWVSGIQSSFDWDDQLRNDWQHLCSTRFKHIKDSLNSQESIWVHFFSDSFKEDGKIVMEIKLLSVYFPVDLVLWTKVLNSDW